MVLPENNKEILNRPVLTGDKQFLLVTESVGGRESGFTRGERQHQDGPSGWTMEASETQQKRTHMNNKAMREGRSVGEGENIEDTPNLPP